jgi:hypothetical protein
LDGVERTVPLEEELLPPLRLFLFKLTYALIKSVLRTAFAKLAFALVLQAFYRLDARNRAQMTALALGCVLMRAFASATPTTQDWTARSMRAHHPRGLNLRVTPVQGTAIIKEFVTSV